MPNNKKIKDYNEIVQDFYLPSKRNYIETLSYCEAQRPASIFIVYEKDYRIPQKVWDLTDKLSLDDEGDIFYKGKEISLKELTERGYTTEHDRVVRIFITREEANNYIKYNKHHFEHETHVFSIPAVGWMNDLILAHGNDLLMEERKKPKNKQIFKEMDKSIEEYEKERESRK